MKPALILPVLQRPQDLKLAIVTEDCLPRTRNLLEKTLHSADFSFRFAIIGESHRVRVSYRDTFLMEEMLACVELDVKNCHHHHPFTDLQSHHFTEKNYSIQVNLSPDSALWNTQQNEIHFVFPAINGATALTKIQWQQSAPEITWRTCHTYYHGQELTCVYSHSQYKFSPEEFS